MVINTKIKTIDKVKHNISVFEEVVLKIIVK